ncbi:MAG: L,D-transpeptidase family protein [bacterium]|nr:L,D-transpeptidase family protein [bacterium]
MRGIAKRLAGKSMALAAIFALALLVGIVAVEALGAQNAHAEGDTRTQITEVVAETDMVSPAAGAAIVAPNVTVISGSPVAFPEMAWLKKSGESWESADGGTFEPGTYKLVSMLQISGEDNERFVIGFPISVTVDGQEWVADWDEPQIEADRSQLQVSSPEFTVAHEPGWAKEDGNWRYYDSDGNLVTNGWAQDSKGTCWMDADGNWVKATKWVKYDGGWYHITNGYMDKSKWMKDSKDWCYLGEDGKMVTNAFAKDSHGTCYLGEDGYWVSDQWVEEDGESYYIKPNHYMATEAWAKDDGGWHWMDADGKIVKSQWLDYNGSQYYLKDDGYMATEMQTIDGENRHFADNGKYAPDYWSEDEDGSKWMNEDGTFATEKWIKDGNDWYYVDSEGYRVENGWAQDSKGWCYLGDDGKMVKSKWIKDNGEWYYLKSDGRMAANEWAKDSHGWMYMAGNGTITKSKWVQYNGYWYYLKANGYMATGTQFIDGKEYYFDPSGKWVNKPTKDTYRVYVNRKQNVITVYSRDANGKYNVPVRSFICSTGQYNATPLGWHQISDKYRWHQLNGGVYGQYCSRYYPQMLFHSVYYFEGGNKASICTYRYNGLGTQTSQGCINMTVIDAKWIYENCPSGTWVYVFDSDSNGPLGKPAAQHLTTNSKWSWCPTDPDPNNPYQKGLKSLTITNPDGQTVAVGGKLKLNVSIQTSGTVGQFAKCVKWVSSNNTVARVDANGNVTGLKAGTATITVYNLPETKKDTYVVRVVP